MRRKRTSEFENQSLINNSINPNYDNYMNSKKVELPKIKFGKFTKKIKNDYYNDIFKQVEKESLEISLEIKKNKNTKIGIDIKKRNNYYLAYKQLNDFIVNEIERLTFIKLKEIIKDKMNNYTLKRIKKGQSNKDNLSHVQYLAILEEGSHSLHSTIFKDLTPSIAQRAGLNDRLKGYGIVQTSARDNRSNSYCFKAQDYNADKKISATPKIREFKKGGHFSKKLMKLNQLNFNKKFKLIVGRNTGTSRFQFKTAQSNSSQDKEQREIDNSINQEFTPNRSPGFIILPKRSIKNFKKKRVRNKFKSHFRINSFDSIIEKKCKKKKSINHSFNEFVSKINTADSELRRESHKIRSRLKISENNMEFIEKLTKFDSFEQRVENRLKKHIKNYTNNASDDTKVLRNKKVIQVGKQRSIRAGENGWLIFS